MPMATRSGAMVKAYPLCLLPIVLTKLRNQQSTQLQTCPQAEEGSVWE